MAKSSDRRPLKTRQALWAQQLAKFLIERNIQPDHVSLAGILFACLAGVLFFLIYLGASKILFFGAAACIQLRLLCNMLDGMVAVEGGKASKFGDLYNELPDRIEDLVILVGAGYSAAMVSGGASWGWAAAVVAILTAYLRAFGGSLGTKQYFLGPMAKPHRMAALTIACLCEGLAASGGYFIVTGLVVIVLGGIVTCGRRIMKITEEIKTR